STHIEPVHKYKVVITNAKSFLAAEKINYATSRVAISKANPTIFGKAHAELSLVVPAVNWTRPAQVVPVSTQPLHETVSAQDLDHRDGAFERVETDKLLLGFHQVPF